MKEQRAVNFTSEIKQTSTVEDLRLIFQQADSRNRSQIDTAESLYGKTVTFLGISVTALSSLLFFISNKDPTLSARYITCCGIIILLSFVCWVLRENIQMKEYYGVGAHPADLVHIDFYTNIEAGKSAEWYILERLIKDYQERIELNDVLNSNRTNNIRSAINWLYWIPAVAVLAYVLAILGLYPFL